MVARGPDALPLAFDALSNRVGVAGDNVVLAWVSVLLVYFLWQHCNVGIIALLNTQALGFTVLALTDNQKTVPPAAAPALIGLTVTLLASQYGPVTGCGMNPARDLGTTSAGSDPQLGLVCAPPMTRAQIRAPANPAR
jgi:hypothetical protein